MFWAARGTPARFLFERPTALWLRAIQARDAAAGGIIFLHPLPARGGEVDFRATARKSGEGASPKPEHIERPPHPARFARHPLPASGERETHPQAHSGALIKRARRPTFGPCPPPPNPRAKPRPRRLRRPSRPRDRSKRATHPLFVDGSGYIFAAYHALPPLTRQVGRAAGQRRARLLQHVVEAAQRNAGR